MKQYYCHYKKWEDVKNGMYKSIGNKKIQNKMIKQSISLLSNKIQCNKYMKKVCNNWYYACKSVFTNNSMNRIAWLGQAACCFKYKIPENITRVAWHHIKPKKRDIANKIAINNIKRWFNAKKRIKK
jgi:hypothetical protein